MHDEEAIVIGYKAAKGISKIFFENQLIIYIKGSIPGIGSLHCKNDKGILFHVGSGLDN